MVTPTTNGYADVAGFVSDWMKTVLGYENVAHELPINLKFVMPLHVVERFGGNEPIITVDVARIDIDTFGPDRAAALAHAETVRQAIRTRLVGYTRAGTVVHRTDTLSPPEIVPYDSRNLVRRATASYQLRLHKYTGI